MTSMQLDYVSLGILWRLRGDARCDLHELAQGLGQDEADIRRRLAFMESSGVIRGYAANIDYTKIGFPLPSTLRLRAGQNELRRMAGLLATSPDVTLVRWETGPFPLRVEVQARNFDPVPWLDENLGDFNGDFEVQTTLRETMLKRPPSLLTTPAPEEAPKIIVQPRLDRI